MSAQPAAAHALANPARSCLEHRRFQFAGADVIEKKQRARAEHRDVIDAVVDEVLADGVVFIERDGELELGAHAVDGTDQYRLAHPAKIRPKQPTEPTRLAQHFRSMGRSECAAETAFETVAEVDVNARAGVGFGRDGGRHQVVGICREDKAASQGGQASKTTSPDDLRHARLAGQRHDPLPWLSRPWSDLPAASLSALCLALSHRRLRSCRRAPMIRRNSARRRSTIS